ncbi:response regulator [Bacteroides sp. OttesenSCG-928-M17]|nr:response regulator [Bacteroides sp. OttesenSCG-928-M17]
MFKPIISFILLSVFFCNASVYAVEPEPMKFVHIGLNEGLSQSTVFAIEQDKRGNMWFATYDGVNRYDGYAFTVYQHSASDPHSIANDIARIVTVDSRGRVWIGTRDGLSYYDEEKDRFKNYFYEKNGKRQQVNAIAELSPTQLLVGTQGGILLFSIEEESFSDDCLSAPIHNTVATNITRQGDDIYIGTNSGLYLYSLADKRFELMHKELGRQSIQTVLKQSTNRLWVATEGDGLYLVNLKTKEIQNYRHVAGDSKSISSNYIRSLALDAQNRLWIGTFNDLNIYHEGTDSFVSHTSNPLQDGSLSQNSVRSIFIDSQEGVWLGTYFGSLNYYHPIRNRFKHLKRIPYHNSLNDNVISCIVEDKEKNLWIGTNDGGINYYDTKTKRFSYYVAKEGSRSAIRSNNIKAIYVDEASNKVYIGTHAGGFSVLNRRNGEIETFHTGNSRLNENNVYAIAPVGDGTLWVASLSELYKFNPRDKQLRLIEKESDGTPLKSRRITLLFRDTKNRLWMGGDEGVAVYNQEGGELSAARTLSDSLSVCNAFINSVYEARNGTFWIGTREGVYGYDERKGTIKHYTTANVLPNNVVYGTLEDSFGRVWMSTNKGLTCLDPDTEKFRTFTESDGLQSNQFNSYSYCRDSSGQMYFGGVNGITAFIPELLMDNPYTPPVVISGLRLFNKTVRPDDETGILRKNISETSSITFKASQTSFSLDFVTLNYISGQKNTFAYKLEGFDKEWYYLTNQRTVSYSNLPNGTYRFLVKAANSDGKWNDTPTELEIIVLPVWYETWWAILLFSLVALSVLIFGLRYSWMRKSMRAELKMERMDKERREEVNQLKMRFFIDISHELRTPLTLILAPLQEIANHVSDRWVRNQLEYIQRNTNRLLHLVNQLMDYRRAELGVLKLGVGKGKIHRLLEENFLFYEKLARNKRIEYTLLSDVDDKEMLYDGNYMELILNNLLSNAFKYTEEGDSITVSIKEKEEYMVLEVADTGVGIPKEKQKKVFERFYQLSSEQAGSGIGLSLVQRLVELHHGRIELESEVGKGSTFSVYIPQNKSLYAPEELESEGISGEERTVHSVNTRDSYFIESEIAAPTEPEEEGEEKKRGTILVVEDNQEIRSYLRDGLSLLFTVAEAANGEEALNYIKENEVDMVITDVMMPVMDGIKLTKQIKQNIRTCHIPVFILSAKTDLYDQLGGLQVGADDYIPKPFTLSVLIAKVQNMLRTRRRTYERYSKSLEMEPEKITFNAMDEELLKRAMSVVEKNMDNIEFSADEFAREMNMSRSNLHLKLKAITGESTIDFIRKIRFKEACKLLEDGRYNIAEVSTKVGFNTPSYFATSFKKYFGYLPTEYVKKRRG